MKETVTGSLLKKLFQSYSKTNSKIFLESITDDKIASNIASFFSDKENGESYLRKCIEYYIEHNIGVGVTLTGFVHQLDFILVAVQELEDYEKELKTVLERTRKRMEEN